MSFGTTSSDPQSPTRRLQPRRAAKSASSAMVGLHRSDSTNSNSSARFSGDADYRQRAFSSSRMSTGSGSDVDEIRFTKTGRISRALKGKRVHVCELCDKYYTRAEHLRRHQLNHGKEPLHCDVPGCKRQFYREDLLIRHKEDHKITNTLPSQSTNGVFNPLSTPQLSHASAVAGQSAAEMGFGETFALSSFDFSHEGNQSTSLPYTYGFWNTVSAPSTLPDLYDSSDPFADRFDDFHPTPSFNHLLPTEDLLTPPLEPYMSSTSHSEASPTIPIWSMLDKPNVRHDFYDQNTPEPSVYAPCDVSLQDVQPLIGPGMGEGGFDVGRYYTELDVFEAARINHILDNVIPPSIRRDGYSNITVLEEIYSLGFWDHFHGYYPVLHVPSYQIAEASPMLRALTIAIGACLSEDNPKTKLISRVLRDTCADLLEKRQEIPYSMARLSDLKTIFWAEFFLIYRSRRTGRGMSRKFQDLLSNLQSDPAVWSCNPLEDLESLSLEPDTQQISRVKHRWIINESKRRLLLACYNLTYERVTLFPDDITQPPTFLDPPLPCSADLWSASTPEAWFELARQEIVPTDRVIDGLAEVERLFKVSHPIALMISHAACMENSAAAVNREITKQLENSYAVQVAKHAGCMTSLTPIHALLAVSGESFVMGQKLANHEQLRHAQTILNEWMQSERAAQATHHALEIFKLMLRSDKIVLLQEQWILYLAALVCWACGIKNRMPQRASSRSLSSDSDLDRFLKKHQSTEPANVLLNDWTGTDVILHWVRNRINGCIGGLIEDAVTVLDKLLETERRN